MGSESQTSIERLKWDQTRIVFFTNFLLDQQRQGKKCDNRWKPEAWSFIVDEFKKRFHIPVEVKQLKAYVQSMKKDYAIIKDLLNQSGFGWNPLTRMVETTDDV